MTYLNRLRFALLLAATTSFATRSVAAEQPAPIQALIDQGFQVHAQFDAPSGMKGFTAEYSGQPAALYLTPDGKHVIVGAILDSAGNNLTATHLKEHLPAPEFANAWSRLEKATWVAEGSPSAKRVVYVFTDPECGYCKKFWHASQPYLGKDAQLRHIIVGVIKPSSMNKAAGILAAPDPARALADHELSGSKGLTEIPPTVERKIQANNALMEQLGISATPAVYYKDKQGKVRRVLGIPDPEMLSGDIFQAQPRR